MKHTTKTVLTAAVFAAALGLSPIQTDVSALIAFSPENQLTSAVLYGPPLMSGDFDGNYKIDARDLTLMKRFLINCKDKDWLASNPSLPYNYRINMSQSICGSSDALTIQNKILDTERPIKFDVQVKWVPYLSTEIPESEEEQQELLACAKAQSTKQNVYYLLAQNETGDDADLRYYADKTYAKFVNHEAVFPVSITTAPNDAEDADPDRKMIHVQLFFRKLTADEAEYIDSETYRSDIKLTEREPDENDVVINLDLCTRSVQEDGSVQYYDKCVVEYDVLTGRYLVHEPLTQTEDFPD